MPPLIVLLAFSPALFIPLKDQLIIHTWHTRQFRLSVDFLGSKGAVYHLLRRARKKRQILTFRKEAFLLIVFLYGLTKFRPGGTFFHTRVS